MWNPEHLETTQTRALPLGGAPGPAGETVRKRINYPLMGSLLSDEVRGGAQRKGLPVGGGVGRGTQEGLDRTLGFEPGLHQRWEVFRWRGGGGAGRRSGRGRRFGTCGLGIPAGPPGSALPCEATRESPAAARSVCVLEGGQGAGGGGGGGGAGPWTPGPEFPLCSVSNGSHRKLLSREVTWSGCVFEKGLPRAELAGGRGGQGAPREACAVVWGAAEQRWWPGRARRRGGGGGLGEGGVGAAVPAAIGRGRRGRGLGPGPGMDGVRLLTWAGATRGGRACAGVALSSGRACPSGLHPPFPGRMPSTSTWPSRAADSSGRRPLCFPSPPPGTRVMTEQADALLVALPPPTTL